MDFIFGTLATDELKLVHHRVARRGVQHNHLISPRDPQPGDAVTITVRTGADLAIDRVACYYTLDGSVPDGQKGAVRNSSGGVLELIRHDLVWDTLAWGYVSIWQGRLPALPNGAIVRYKIGAWSDANGSDEIFGDWPEFKATTERAAAAFFRGEPLPDDPAPAQTEPDIFTFHVDTFTVPQWAKNAVIYEIFVERFYPGDGREWLNAKSLEDYYGGTLWGVRDKMDYIADLGVTCIWLTPTFPSPTYHGYDPSDYLHVEPRLGGDESLHAVVEAAHACGIRVLLDLVCNHVSYQHPYFVDALNSAASPYREWFTFGDNYAPLGYKTFFGVESMPYINLKNDAARAWMVDIARYWLREFDVDGYRLDHANGPGPDFWSEFWTACKQVKPASFCFGEVVEAPDILQQYVGRLDGLLDFMMEDALRKTFAYKTWTEDEFERFIAQHYAYFPQNFAMPTFLDNHDMDRFLFAANGDVDALKRAAAAQMRLPQPPIIYYGTEVGLNQNKGKGNFGLEVSRLPMPWGDAQNHDLLAFYKRIIAERRNRV